MRWLFLAPLVLLIGCRGYLDPRCYQNSYYCLSVEQAEVYLRKMSDRSLIQLAAMDYRTSHPPSGRLVREMARRGPDRAKAILFEYAGGNVDEDLIDEMVRQFSDLGDVCGNWLANAPQASHSRLQAACYRVFDADHMAELRKAAEATRRTLGAN